MSKTQSILDQHYSSEDMEEMIVKMRNANAAFYGMAVQTGVHTFIEFCGLQSKFIDLCAELLAAGVEFPMVSVHTGKRVKVAEHHIDYLAEKFECIYGPIFAGNPELAQRFIQLVFRP